MNEMEMEIGERMNERGEEKRTSESSGNLK